MPTPHQGLHRTASQRVWRCLAWIAALTALGLVFLLYFKSQLVFDLATRIWSCF